MRDILAIALLLSIPLNGLGDQPEQVSQNPWQPAFTMVSASEAEDSLVLLLVTNEDPFPVEEAINESPDRNEPEWNPPVWCASVLAQAYRETLQTRSDLKGKLVLQSIAAGLPQEVTGGSPRNTPSRAVLLVCDGNYRLLGLMVGVPAADDLRTLIEDAEDVRLMRKLNRESPETVIADLAQRSSARLNRLWRGALEEVAIAMQGERDPDQDDSLESETMVRGQMRLLSGTFEPTYLADVRLRFGLSESTDKTRLVILEQHIEARHPWCEAMIPFVAGADLTETWRELVESLWGHQPITTDGDAQELLDWVDLQIETDALVLSLTPPMHLQNLPWPPIAKSGAKRGLGWTQVHQLAQSHPFRTIDVQQLALLIRSRKLKAVDIYQPTLARYLLVEPRKRLPQVIRENDPPGRFAGLLKRSKSSLVKQ